MFFQSLRADGSFVNANMNLWYKIACLHFHCYQWYNAYLVNEAQFLQLLDTLFCRFLLKVLGMERLKTELQVRGLKCGGTLQERAARLFLLKSTPLEKLPKKLLAKKWASLYWFICHGSVLKFVLFYLLYYYLFGTT
jgi:hypothetical protein